MWTAITDLKGIEHFTALTKLNCSNTGITNLDVSKNTALLQLNCADTNITCLNISNNAALTNLYCDKTRITSLDVSNNKSLTYLDCSVNSRLKNLKVEGAVSLATLFCNDTGITNLDVSNNTAMSWLVCPRTPLAYLNIGTNDKLTDLSKYELKSVNLYITEATFNIEDKFPGIKLGKISDVKNATYDKSTGIMSNFKIGTPITYTYECGKSASGFEKISVTLNTDVLEINEENFPDATFRERLGLILGQTITSDEIRGRTEIQMDALTNIKTLKGIEYFTALEYLSCFGTGITTLDVSNNTALLSLTCFNTGITSLDVSKNEDLRILRCNNTEITNLDVSNNTALSWLNCSKTPLAYLNIGENINLTDFDKSNLKPINLNITESTFNIEEKFPGIDVSKISAVDNATFNNTTKIISNYKIGTPITYTYDCGTSSNGHEEIKVTLNLTDPRGDSTLSITDSLSKIYDANTVSATPTVSKSGSTGAVSYKWEKKVNDAEWKEINSLPIDVGTYRVTATLAPDNDYKGIDSLPVEFTISEASNSLTKPLSIKGWKYGKTANQPSATITFGSVTYLYCYSKDGIYSRIVPTDAGTWYVKVMVEGTDNYESFESTPVSFVIAPMNVQENSQITVPDITADTDINKLAIKDGDKVLKQGTDYNATKKQDRKKVNVTITFKGNYAGTITKTYTEAEKVPSGDDNKPEEKVDVPTGDNTQTGLLTTISLLSIGCIAFLTGKKRKKS